MPIETRKDGVTAAATQPSVTRLLEGLLERSLDAITLTDRASRRFVEVSDSFCALTGYGREELIGRTASEVGLVAEDAQRASVIANADRSSGGLHEFELRRRDGMVRSLEASLQLLNGDEVVLTIIRDVTDRKRVERDLAAREARFRAVADSTLDGLAIISPVHDDRGEIVDLRYEYVNDAYCALVEFERGQLLGRRLGDLFPRFADSERFAACREVVSTGEPWHTENVAPVDVQDASALDGRVADVRIAAIGRDLVVSARDVSERRRLEAQLRTSETRFRSAVEAMRDTVAILSPIRDRGEIIDFRYEYANDASCSLMDLDRARLLGHAVGELFPAFPGSDRFALYRRVAVTGEPATSEDLIGEQAWGGEFAGGVFDTVIVATGENIVISGRDVTARYNAQRARAAAEARFYDVIESAPDAMVIVNPDGEILLANAQTEKLFGYARAELIGQNQELLVPEQVRDRHRDHRARYQADPRARPMGDGLELFARRKDGTQVPVEISLSPLGTETGTLTCSAIRDITPRRQLEHERKLAEDELRHSRARLAEAELVAGIGSWEQDLSTGTVTVSDGMLKIHGLTANQFDGSPAAARELIHPQDRDHVAQTIDRAITERSSYTVEYRAIRTDGRVRNLRGYGDVLVDDTGEPTRTIGIVQDITDTKLTKEKLQSASAELARRANELQQIALRTAHDPPDIPHAPLTARQMQILQLIAQGHTNAAIAERLVVTEGTIKWHVRQILAKTNSSNRAEAIARVLGTPP